MTIGDRSNLYLSQGQVNRVGGAWEPRNDRGLNNYEAPSDGSGCKFMPLTSLNYQFKGRVGKQ